MAEYIEREAALRPFVIDKNGNRIREVDVDNWLVEIPIKQVKKMLREIPAADVVEVVHGKVNFARDDGILMGECSICGTVAIATQAARWNFCPNCGADMREV